MISKEELYRFLVELDSQYENSKIYFKKHPCNDMQRMTVELEDLCEKHGLCVTFGYRAPDDVVSYDISSQYDLSGFIANGIKLEDLTIGVYSKDIPRVSLSPSDVLFKQIVDLYIKCDGMNLELPTDIITIDDMSFTVHDILVAINHHAKHHRLKKYMIIDRYVPYETELLTIHSTKRYSEELCDEIEEFVEKALPYWNGNKLNELIPDEESFHSWEDLFNGGVEELSYNNIVYLCQNLPDSSYSKNIPALNNIVTFINTKKDRFMSAMLIRALTRARIQITYVDVPVFKDFVGDMSLYIRELRNMM